MIAEVRGRATAAYGFSHALVCQWLSDELPPPRRQRLYLRAAEAIEAVHARALDRRVAALTAHHREAGAAADPEKAVGYAERAARWSRFDTVRRMSQNSERTNDCRGL